MLRIQTPKGPDLPYALDDNKFYVRDEADTSLAVRDEIVALVREAFGLEREAEPEEGDLAMLPTPAVSDYEPLPPLGPQPMMLPEVPVAPSGRQSGRQGGRGGRGRQGSGNAPAAAATAAAASAAKEALKVQPKEPAKEQPKPQPANQGGRQQGKGQQAQPRKGSQQQAPAPQPARQAAPVPTNGEVDTTFYLPQIGVEIIEAEERNGHTFYAIRDMRNGHVIKNITRHGAEAVELCDRAVRKAGSEPPADRVGRQRRPRALRKACRQAPLRPRPA